MLLSGVGGAAAERARKAHVVVVGNEKGGSGKSTIAIHITIALLKSGFKVATVDLDGRQQSLTRYVENRKRRALGAGVSIPTPEHFHVPPSRRETVSDAESDEFRRLIDGLGRVEDAQDFVIVDTPGSDTFLNRLAHRLADTLITPMNDSFVDLDVLAKVDPAMPGVFDLSPYALAVREARRQRRQMDGTIPDWIVIRNRTASDASHNEREVGTCLHSLATKLGFRVADGISERVIFREFFSLGLTALDDVDDRVPGDRPTLSHLAARQEIRQLLAALRLPGDKLRAIRAEASRRQPETSDTAMALPDIVAG